MMVMEFFAELRRDADAIETVYVSIYGLGPPYHAHPKDSFLACLSTLQRYVELSPEERHPKTLELNWKCVRENGLKLGIFQKYEGDVETRENLRKFLKGEE